MKKISIVAAALTVAAVASADIYVNAVVGFGIYDQADGVSPLIANPGGEALMQLFYVGGNGVADYEDGSFGVLGAGGASGDDVLLGSFTFTAAGGAFDGYLTGANFTSTDLGLAGGNVFARVFQGTGGAGDWYYQGAIFAASDLDQPGGDPPDSYLIDGGVAAIANTGQVIPEPATIGLMGIAGVGMFLARRKARR
jgi:hypothetical protein